MLTAYLFPVGSEGGRGPVEVLQIGHSGRQGPLDTGPAVVFRSKALPRVPPASLKGCGITLPSLEDFEPGFNLLRREVYLRVPGPVPLKVVDHIDVTKLVAA